MMQPAQSMGSHQSDLDWWLFRQLLRFRRESRQRKAKDKRGEQRHRRRLEEETQGRKPRAQSPKPKAESPKQKAAGRTTWSTLTTDVECAGRYMTEKQQQKQEAAAVAAAAAAHVWCAALASISILLPRCSCLIRIVVTSSWLSFISTQSFLSFSISVSLSLSLSVCVVLVPQRFHQVVSNNNYSCIDVILLQSTIETQERKVRP